MNTPRISVLMTCYNSNPELLQAAINSVLNQTYQDFIFVIVDDGSSVPMNEIVGKISSDERIQYYYIEHVGLGAALTYGISKCVTEYIARLDDDDLMVHNRLEKQLAYLDNHPDVSCVGSQRYSYCNGKYMKHRRFPTEHEDIIKSMLSLKWAIAHSALMYRKANIVKAGCYRIKGTGEDLDMILQLSLTGKLANIDEYLVYYYLSMGSLATRENQLFGHLYALSEYEKCDRSLKYSAIITKSLNHINSKLSRNKKVVQWKKWITVHVVGWFGKKLPNVL